MGSTLKLGSGLHLTFFSCKAGAAQPYTVPADTHSVYVEAVGGEGMTPNPDKTGWGGSAGQVTGSLAVTPGEKLSVAVGCGGTSGGGASPYAPGGAKGLGRNKQTFAMSSYGVSAGGGGGASAVQACSAGAGTCDPTKPASLKPLVVAGGGGGAAGGAPACYKLSIEADEHAGYRAEAFWYVCHPPIYQKGGNGGRGGNPAAPGTVGENNESGAAPGGGACATAERAGENGEDFNELGGGGAGGGGGGGYRGGCAGSAGGETLIVDNPAAGSLTGRAGNGGGGGQSYADAGRVNQPGFSAADNAGDGYVLILSGADTLRTSKYGFTGRTESKCVPARTDKIFVNAVGGAGGGGGSDFSGVGTGGGGGSVQAVVPVSPGKKLLVTVGQYGHGGGGFGDGSGGARGPGGLTDSEKSGAGGGGSSAVKSTSSRCGATKPTGPFSPLVVAAGGGGGGGETPVASSGDGGNGGNPPAAGDRGGSFDSGAGGLAGAPSDGPGKVNGGDGTDGGSSGGGGGGGGGGYYGGGGGHGPHGGQTGAGGGGGGGRSYAFQTDPTQVRFGTGSSGARRADGSVTLVVPFPAQRSEVEILGGSAQSALPGRAFAQPLQVKALDANGLGLKQVRIDFTAPDGYAVFANGSRTHLQVTTGDDGRATVPIKAQAPPWQTGPFEIAAQVTGQPDIKAAKFSLFNVSVRTALTLTSCTPGPPLTSCTRHASNRAQPVRFTATVAQASPRPLPDEYGTPTGDVQFAVDGAPVGAPVALDPAGQAATDLRDLAQGPRRITAIYLSDARHVFASTSADTIQAVQIDAPVMTLSSSAGTAPIGTPVHFGAEVNAPQGVSVAPTGNVRFSVDGTFLKTVTLSGGNAAAPPVSDLGVGLHTVVARYSGDDGFLPNVRTIYEYVKAASSVTLTPSHRCTFSSDYCVYPGQTLTLSATVASATPGVSATPQGEVVFTSDGKKVVTVTLNKRGQATTPPVNLGAAVVTPHHVVASYSGADNRFAASQDSKSVYVYTLSQPAPGGAKPAPGGPGPSPPIVRKFSCQGATSQTFPVPTDHPIYSMDVTAVGGTGGDGFGAPGGRGGIASGSRPVRGGQKLGIDVGCTATAPIAPVFGETDPGASPFAAGGAGGPGIIGRGYNYSLPPFPTTGNSGGGGGGASAVLGDGRTMLVAGGGGGGGGIHYPGVSGTLGGAGGNPAQPGVSCSVAQGPCVGGAGGSLASRSGGQGTKNPCPKPTTATYGASGGSGGGGGGWLGGDAGSFSACSLTGTAAGGGGGLSYADPAVTGPKFSTASNSGDGSITVTLRAGGAVPAVALSVSPRSLVLGDQARFTATLSTPLAGAPVPTGTVSFSSGGLKLGTRTLDGHGGATSDLTPHLTVGPYPLTVVYSGDSNYAPKTTATTLTVAEKAPSITVSLTPEPLVDGAPATFTAKPARAWPQGPVPTGTMQFLLNGDPVGIRVHLNPDGSATSGRSDPLPFGANKISATYSGDSNYLTGTATKESFAQGHTFVTLKSAHNPILPRFTGEELTFSAAVQGTGDASGTPTGTVRFSVDRGKRLIGVDGQPLDEPLPLVNGAVRTPVLDQSALPISIYPYAVVAEYSGDKHFRPSKSTLQLYSIAALS
ncbi:MAG: Ig-like domain-containing protein [Solirubrobacteraceae bacterium]